MSRRPGPPREVEEIGIDEAIERFGHRMRTARDDDERREAERVYNGLMKARHWFKNRTDRHKWDNRAGIIGVDPS